MKITRIKITNIGAISEADIPITKGLNIFYGSVKQGKTTILNAIKWSFGGSFPIDIIKHGEQEAYIHLTFDDNSTVRREFYIQKSGETTARPIQYIKDGILQSNPVKILQSKLNPFHQNQNYFKDMSPLEKIRYAIDLFGAGTKEDTTILESIKKAGSELRKKITDIKYMDAEKVEPVDVDKLNRQLELIKSDNKVQEIRIDGRRTIKSVLDDHKQEKIDLNERLAEIAESEKKLTEELKSIPDDIAIIDTSIIEQKISDAKLINYKAEQYEKAKQFNFNQDEEKAFMEDQIKLKTAEYKKKSAEVKAKLKDLNGSHGIPGLVFIEGDTFMYENTSADMLSTSQNAKLSSALQAKYPDTMSVELIDQGESWGNSIYDLIDKAIKENKVILTTVVGEKPAKTTKDVGVFYVNKGEVTGE